VCQSKTNFVKAAIRRIATDQVAVGIVAVEPSTCGRYRAGHGIGARCHLATTAATDRGVLVVAVGTPKVTLALDITQGIVGVGNGRLTYTIHIPGIGLDPVQAVIGALLVHVGMRVSGENQHSTCFGGSTKQRRC
jgi:hypothetical protein